MTELRSSRWFAGNDVAGLIHRAYLRSEGFTTAAFDGRPVIGICNSWSELVNCNVHLRDLATAVKRGVLQAGGLPLEFPVMSLGEVFMKPTTFMYRNLMAMDVEETIRANPLDAVVLLSSCDKTIPAALMGALSVDVPTIMVTGGPSQPGVLCGRRLGGGTDLWHYTAERRAGRMSEGAYSELEAAMVPSVGHCPEMGTASTMACLVEGLGMSLPGSATIPAVDARRRAVAEAAGRRAVEMAYEDLRPSRILNSTSFDNAIALLVAMGGSTNAVIHLLALAGRAGVDLELDRFAQIAQHVPMLVNVRPAGDHLVEQLFHAGGVPAVLRELAPLIDLHVPTVAGQPLVEAVAAAPEPDEVVIARLSAPFQPPGGLAVLRGTLAPGGAVIKRSAASPALCRHRGNAIVFEDIYDLAARIDDPVVPADASSVLVLRNAGPVGAPGMPEWGMLPIPRKLLEAGVRDMVRISDARMSGTAFGTVVLHVAPESAVGGPLAVVQTGDPIVLDVAQGRLDLDIDPAELQRRLAAFVPPAPKYRRGYGSLFLDHVLQADRGCDFDFLVRQPAEPPERDPLGMVGDPIAGW